ncbi:B12-binding domain-containing radical SAM protein [Patescibacteria group bacterium]|nr:B12-binding domain-containing radical SAM protein [Patescibacteria group bacterium]
MKILLINPPYTNFEGGMKESGGHSMPYNLAYLAAYLRERIDCQIKILDAEVRCLNFQEIEEEIRKEQPDIAGITCPSSTMNHVFRICQIIKQNVNSNCLTIVGGNHPTIMPEKTLEDINIDFAAMSESEITFYEFVRTIKEGKNNFKSINGLCYKENGKIVKNPLREFIADLDTIPFPALDLLDLEIYYSAPTKKLTTEKCSPLLTSRGCAFNCIHCASKALWRRQVRYRSAENVVAEIESHLNKYDIKEFNLLDEHFTINKPRAMKICQLIIDKKLPIAWACLSRSDAIDDELVEIMGKAGCKKISLGLESGSQKILDLMRKQATIKQGREAIKTIRRHNILANSSFMFGNIGETKKTIRETIDYAKSLDLDNATFFITCPLPGSDLYTYAKDNGLIPENVKWEMFAPLTNAAPVLAQRNLSGDELIYWQKRAFREYYLRPKYIIYKLKMIDSWDIAKSIIEGIRIFIRVLIKKPKKI